MRKEDILKQVVVQEYGEKKHQKLTESQLLLSPDLYEEVKSMYKELGGTLKKTSIEVWFVGYSNS